MIINKEGKLFGKISIIDIVVVLAIIVLALGLYMRFANSDNTKVSTEKQQIEYSVLIKGVRMGTVQALSQLGPITNDSTKEYAGEIVDVTYTDALETRELSNGKVVETLLPERYNVIAKIQVDGRAGNSGYYTSTNQSINIGSTLLFTSKYANTSGTIVDVKEIK
ncbi:MAG: DUF4330 domain-containing protein [Clostridia bacterium]|nr:DUF4330 domain-containing protein [Clostridia bacterium]